MNSAVRYYTERLFVATSGTYLLLIAVLPVSKNTIAKYHLAPGQVILLTLAIIIPYLVIWYIAIVGYAALKGYVLMIQPHSDGAAFNSLANGILLLALWLPASGAANAILNAIQVTQPQLIPLTVWLNNYLNIAFLLIAFIVILRASKQLLHIIGEKERAMPTVILTLFLAFSSLYTYLVLTDPARHAPIGQVAVASYYSPDWLIVLTIVIPRLITWYIGIRAVYNIYMYRQKVSGRIYRTALFSLANGILWVGITIMVLRFFQSLTVLFSGWSLAVIVLIVYALLVLIGVGYVLITKGTRKLLRIEEV